MKRNLISEKGLKLRARLGRFLGLLVWGSTLAANGCGSSSGSQGAAAVVTLEQFGEQAVKRYCAQVGACCSELSYPFDEAGCEALNGNNIVQYFNFEFFPGAHYDAAAGQRCLDGIETPELGCAASADYESADCQKVFVGSVPLGGTCSLDEGCAEADGSATECDLPFDPNREDQDPKRTGVCVLAPPAVTSPHGKLGDACGSTCIGSDLCLTLCNDGQDCQSNVPACYSTDGLVCSEANVCAPMGVAGDPCQGSPDCATGTFCADDLHCRPWLQEGDPCQNGLQCETNYCDKTCTRPPVANPDFCLGHIPPPPN